MVSSFFYFGDSLISPLPQKQKGRRRRRRAQETHTLFKSAHSSGAIATEGVLEPLPHASRFPPVCDQIRGSRGRRKENKKGPGVTPGDVSPQRYKITCDRMFVWRSRVTNGDLSIEPLAGRRPSASEGGAESHSDALNTRQTCLFFFNFQSVYIVF